MVKTIEYSAGVTPVDFSQAIPYGGSNRYYAVMNYGKKDIFISNKNDAAEGADGSKRVPAGECRGIDMQGLNVLYIAAQSAGTAEIDTAAGISALGFRSGARGGDDTVSEEGNPVQIDGLQGGVPFNRVSVSGKNLLKYPYNETQKTQNGITFTQQSDGGIAITGQLDSGMSAGFLLKRKFRINETVCISGGRENIRLQINTNDNRNIWDNGNGAVISYEDVNYLRIFVSSEETEPIDTVIYPQMELGDTATEYTPPITGREMILNVNGTEYAITPDSNPYTVPVDITQYDGINVLSISDDSNPIISVSGNKASEQLGTIYRTLNNKPVLLFDGTIPTTSGSYAEFSIDKEYTALIIVPTCNTSSTYIPGACTVIPISYIEAEEKDFSVFGYPRSTAVYSRAYIKRDGNTIYVRESSSSCDYLTVYGI